MIKKSRTYIHRSMHVHTYKLVENREESQNVKKDRKTF